MNCQQFEKLRLTYPHPLMKTMSEIKAHQLKLQNRYKQLIEQAYNFRQTDSALSDLSEYKAYKLLYKLNRLRFLNRETLQQSPK